MKFFWNAASDGDFADGTKWTPSGPPGAGDQAMLTATGAAYIVDVFSKQTVLTIDTSADVTLDIQGSGITFTAEEGTGSGANNGEIDIGESAVFVVAGTINNKGTINLFAGAGATITLLGDTTLNGGALILGEGNVINGTGTLTNTGNSDISGDGSIEVAVNNKVTVLPGGNIIPLIDGDGDSTPLTLDGIVTNTGELRGEGAAGLLIQNNVNNTGGLIDASSGQVVIGNGATIVGGTLQNTGGTFLIGNASLDGGGTHPITLVGDIAVDAGQNLFTQGAFKNPNGSLDLQSGSSLLLGFSNASGIDTTFSGDDQIVLTNGTIDLNALTHVGSTPLKLNNVNDIIIGTGTIGNAVKPGSFVLNNEAKGVVEALSGVLTIQDGLGHTAQLHFSGAYTLASFNLNPDGHGGTLLTDPPVAHPANPTLFGHHMAAAFPEAFGSRLTKFETAAHPLLALPHG